MKYLIILIISFFITSSSINAQWQKMTLGSNTAQKLEVINNDTAILTFTNSIIYKTNDAGENWIDISPINSPSKILQSIDFYNNNIGIIGVSDSFLLVTNNTGDNWNIINQTMACKKFSGKPHSPMLGSQQKFSAVKAIEPLNFLTTLSYKDSSNIYYNYLLQTKDGGTNWDTTRLESIMGLNIYFTAIEFVNINIGYIIGTKGTLLKTIDGGKSWNQIDLTGSIIDEKSINDIKIISNDSIYLATQDGIVFTHDAFNTFDIFLPNESIFDIEIVMDSITLAGRGIGKTSRSINNGQSFEFAINGLEGSIFDISSFNGELYGLSTSGNIYTLPSEQLLNPIASFDTIKTSSNTISITNTSKYSGSYSWDMDDGKIINGDISEFTFLKKGIYQINLSATNAVTTDIDNSITIVVDSITNYWGLWNTGSETLAKMISLNNDTAIISNIKTEIFYTTDGGITFNKSSIPDSLYGHVSNDIFFLNSNIGFSTYSYRTATEYDDGFMLKTEDTGVTWNIIDTSYFSDKSRNISTDPSMGIKHNFYSGEPINDSTALVTLRWEDLSGTKYGGIYKTTDTGNTWTPILDTLFNNYSSIITALKMDKNGITGYITGNKLLYKTNDGGNTWNNISNDTLGYINDLILLDNNTVLLATSTGIFKSINEFSSYTHINHDYCSDIVTINDSTFITGKNQSTLKFTYDGGDTWLNKGEGISSSFFELEIFDDKLYALSSQGKTFITLIDNFTIPVSDFSFSTNMLEANFTNLSTNNSYYFWNFGDGNFSTEESPTHKYSNNGNYSVTLTTTYNGNKISKTTDINVTGVSISDNELSKAKLYPNPSENGNFNITLPNNNSHVSVTIQNIKGQVIFNQTFIENCDISINQNLTAGIYIVSTEYESSKNYSKLIVE